jgi:hypothetical protein
LALVWEARKRLRCDGCGQQRDESLDPANRYAYEAHAVKCFSCEDRELLAERKRGKGTEGVQVYVVKVPDDD